MATNLLQITTTSQNGDAFVGSGFGAEETIPNGRHQIFKLLSQQSEQGTGDLILPHGVKYIEERSGSNVVVCEFAPKIWSFVHGHSGPHNLQMLRLSLPYVILVFPVRKILFTKEDGKQIRIFYPAGTTQCVFMTRPLTSLDDVFCNAVLDNTVYEEERRRYKNWMCLGSNWLEGVDSFVQPGEKSSLEWWRKYTEGQIPHHEFLQMYIKGICNLIESRSFNYAYRSYSTNYGVMAPNIPGIYPYSTWQENTIRDPRFGMKVSWPIGTVPIRRLVNECFAACTERADEPDAFFAARRYCLSQQS